MFKKILSILLTVCMLTALTGCGQKEKTGAMPGEGEKGRYVENKVSLPSEINGQDIGQIAKKGNDLCIYVREDGGSIARYFYKEGNFEKDTPAWLQNIHLTEEQDFKVMEDINGKSYLFCVDRDGDHLLGHLFVSLDGEGTEEITPKDWLTEDPEKHYFDCPQDVVILQDGCIAANMYGHGKIYDGESRELLKDFRYDGEHTQNIYAAGDQYYLLLLDDHYELKGIELYSTGNDSPDATLICDEKIGSDNGMDILSDGSLIVAGENGIYKYDMAHGEWRRIVAGGYTSFSLSSKWCVEFTALDNDTYFALFAGDSGERELMEYVYDPEISLTPDIVLTVYTVYENPTLKQAASMYGRQHPEVYVDVETEISYEEEDTADLDAVLQNLNTKLLAGNGADILVLDGLNAAPFIEKGILSDISDVVLPMAQDGTILENITADYCDENGAVYMIPLRFGVNLLIGGRVNAKEAGTVKDLADVLSRQKESILGPMTVDTLTETFVPYMVSDIVEGKQLNKKALAEDLTYLKKIADNSGIVEKYTDKVQEWSMWDIVSCAGAAFCETNGFLDAMFPVSLANQVKGSFTCFENAFQPIGQTGINSNTANPDIAKDFLRYALSFEIQDSDFYDGFPMNTEALENQIKKDRSEYTAYASIDTCEGQSVDIEVVPLNESDGKALVEMCKGLNKRTEEDVEIESVISEVLPDYLQGSASLEDTVSKIEKGLNMYLAE